MDEATQTTQATEYTIPDVLETAPAETLAITLVPDDMEMFQGLILDTIHADLFGAFLICGLLVGIFLLRGLHGT